MLSVRGRQTNILRAKHSKIHTKCDLEGCGLKGNEFYSSHYTHVQLKTVSDNAESLKLITFAIFLFGQNWVTVFIACFHCHCSLSKEKECVARRGDQLHFRGQKVLIFQGHSDSNALRTAVFSALKAIGLCIS